MSNMPGKSGIAKENADALVTSTRQKVNDFLEENLPGHVDCDTEENRQVYKELYGKMSRQKFGKKERDSLYYVLFYSTIEFAKQRTKIEEDLYNLEEKHRKIDEEAQRLVEIHDEKVEPPGNASEEELLEQLEEDLKRPEMDIKMYALRLLKLSQNDANRIKTLEETIAVLRQASKQKELVIHTPRRVPRINFKGLRASANSQPSSSGEADNAHNTTRVGDEIDEDDDDAKSEGEQPTNGEEEERKAREQAAQKAENHRRQVEADNRGLREAQIPPFSGDAKDKPYGNNFNRFMNIFDEYAGEADNRTRKLVLIEHLKGRALQLYHNKMDEIGGSPDFEEIVELMKGVFYPVEVDSSKLQKYRELMQREDQHLDEFFVDFKIKFRDFLEVTTGQEDLDMGNGKMMCKGLYHKIRKTLRDALDKKKPYMWEQWRENPFSIDNLYEELKRLEAALPPREQPKQRPPESRQPPRFNPQQRPFDRRPTFGYNTGAGQRCRYCGMGNHTEQDCRQKLRDAAQRQARHFPAQSRGSSIQPLINRDRAMQNKRQNYSGNRGRQDFDPSKRYGDKNRKFKPNSFDQREGNRANNSWKMSRGGGSQSSPQNYGQRPFTPRGGQNINAVNMGQWGKPPEYSEKQPQKVQQLQSGNKTHLKNKETHNVATPLAMFNYSLDVARNKQGGNMPRYENVPIRFEVDEDTPYNPEHSTPMSIFRCYSKKQDEWKKVVRYSLWKNHLVDNDNPPWIREGNEELIENCADIVEWSKDMKNYQETAEWPKDSEEKIARNREVRNMCVDTMQFRFALIILDVYIEDVLYDTGSMYNAISLKAFYDLAGRFESFTQAFSEAHWDPQMKHVSVVGGGKIPVLATVELEVQTSTGKSIPIVWAIYDDVDYIIIVGTQGMRALGFQCKSPELNNYDLFKGREKSEQIAAKFYEPAIAPWRSQDAEKLGTQCLKPEQPANDDAPSTSKQQDGADTADEDEDIEEMLASNAAAIKLLADAQNLGPFILPEERSSIMGGLLLQTALEDVVEPLIDLEPVNEEDFRPENIPDEEAQCANNNALISEINKELERQDFPLVSLEPKPPNFLE